MDLKAVPFLLADRFGARPLRWRLGAPLVPELEPWRDVYDRIEEVRAAPGPEALRELAALIRGRGMLDRPESLAFQVTVCHAVAEVLLRTAEWPWDRDLARGLLGICPPGGWIRSYADLLLEVSEGDPDADLVVHLAERACELAEEAEEPHETIRALRRLRAEAKQAYGGGEPPGELPELLTADQISRLLGVTLITARRMLTDGTIPSKKVGRQRYVRHETFLSQFDPDRRRRK